LEKEIENITSLIKKHKIIFLVVFIILIIVGVISYSFIGGLYSTRMGVSEYAPAYVPLTEISKTSYEQQIEQSTGEILSKPSEYQIKKGSASIKSTDASSDYEKLRQKTESLNGWVETVSRNEDYRQISITTNLKIPFENFDSFADWLMKNFDVKNANLELYRVTVERQQDEIQILQMALNIYDKFLQRTETMNVTESSIELAMKITQRKLDVMRLLRQYGYSVEQVEKQSKDASLSITLTQEKKIELMPEDLGRELRSKLRNSVRDITNAGMDLITMPVVIFIKIIVWITYAIIVLVPIFVAFKIIVKIFKLIWNKV
jgi:predicted RND superfamily exporter protein